MVEVVLVRFAVARFHAVEIGHFGQNDGQQAAALQFYEADRWHLRHHYFVQLCNDAFGADYLDAVAVAAQSFEGFVLNSKVELGGKTHAAHHAQRVVAEGDVGVEWGGYDAVLKVAHTIERVDQLAEPGCVEADGHGVDGEVAAVLVVLKGTVFDNGFA